MEEIENCKSELTATDKLSMEQGKPKKAIEASLYFLQDNKEDIKLLLIELESSLHFFSGSPDVGEYIANVRYDIPLSIALEGLKMKITDLERILKYWNINH